MDPFTLVYRHLGERLDALSEHLVSGNPRTMEEYRQVVGSIQEVKRLLEEVKDIERRVIADE
jgi:hypothetical protein